MKCYNSISPIQITFEYHLPLQSPFTWLRKEILLITSRYNFSSLRKIYTCLWYLRQCVYVYVNGYQHINIYIMGIDLLNIFY